MKGITPVIAIILLLLVTIAMVGFAVIWFQRFVQTAGSEVNQRLESDLAKQSKTISIANTDTLSVPGKTTVSVRNTGTRAIIDTDLAFFIDAARATLESCASTTIQPGQTVECTLASSCTAGDGLRVTAPGNSDERVC